MITGKGSHIASPLNQLRAAAIDRRRRGFRPATHSNYVSSITLYIQFCVIYDIPVESPTQNDFGAFCEFLIRGELAPATIKNYFSAIRAFYAWWPLPLVLKMLKSQATTLTIRGISYTVRSPPDVRAAMTVEHLEMLVHLCASDPKLLPFRFGFTLAFFGYLRISNITPPSANKYDESRHRRCRTYIGRSGLPSQMVEDPATRCARSKNSYPCIGRFARVPGESLATIRE